MPAEWNAYETQAVKLLDITFSAVKANTTNLQTPQTGTLSTPAGNSISVTTNSIANTNVPSGYVWDAFIIDVTSPVASDLTFPDFTFTIANGSTNLQQLFQIDGSMQGNMAPSGQLVRGQRRILIGKPARETLTSGSQDVTVMTGIKVTNTAGLTLFINSTAGWTNPLVPARVTIRGESLTTAEVSQLMPLLTSTQFTVGGGPNGTYSGTYTTNQADPLAFWNSLPGGAPGGVSAQINRKIIEAYNNVSVSAGTRFVFSQQNVFGGVPSNLASSYNDLGDDFRTGGQAFEWLAIGFNLYTAGQQGYLAFLVDNTVVPQETTNGVFITQGNNPFAYGGIGSTGQFYGLKPANQLAQVFSNANAITPIFQPVGGAVAANAMSFAKSGVSVVGG